MGKKCLIFRWRALAGLIALIIGAEFLSRGQPAKSPAPSSDYTIVELQPQVFVKPPNTETFHSAHLNDTVPIGTTVRVGTNGAVLLQYADQSVFRGPSKSEFIVPPPKTPTARPGMRLLSGVLYFFHRGKPTDVEVQTRTASAAIRGTEFAIAIDDAGVTTVTMIDGAVDLSNDAGNVNLQSGQQGIAEPGKAPYSRAAIDAINVIQWTLYYPGVLDVDEIGLSDREQSELSSSLNAYRTGDLIRAANEYPSGRQPQSDAEKIYFAGLMLAVGEVEPARKLLSTILESTRDDAAKTVRLAGALEQVIAAVKLEASAPRMAPELATEFMAESYRLQSQADLPEALRAARSAAEKSPRFSFAWARVAELEFSFGRIEAASEAVAKSLELSPRNAQAIAQNGFLFAARNKMDSAIQQFDEAIAIDGRLANAWLGRGLSLIHKGRVDEGRENLVTATALELRRAFLRSYLAKAWADDGKTKLAEHELELAKDLDPRDPTALLYSALLKQRSNRINEAIRDLEHAQDLSTNRAVYRSEFMLDEDRAVRSANLANIYRDAGMIDWSVREASRAVAADYGNYSAHLFLANSYDQLQDPNRINLRYETATESEYLIANLLAPVGAGTLSRSVSQGEYSRLFERNHFGVVSTTEYLSRGAFYENGAQYGIFGNTAYSLEGIYRTDPGQRVNNDFEERDLRIQVKQQLTYKDSIFIRASELERSGGDELQYYDPKSADPFIRTRERQEPILTLGYHREWSPGVHTLFLTGRLDDNYLLSSPQQTLLFMIPSGPQIIYVEPVVARLAYRSEVNIYTAEVQQIWQVANNTATVGARFQRGDFNTSSSQTDIFDTVPTGKASEWIPAGQIYSQTFRTPFERVSAYGYDSWKVTDDLIFVGGIGYDRIVYPANFLAPPISDSTLKRDHISPKIGFIWSPDNRSTLRLAYSQSLTGASMDQSLTIEPSQVAGVNQAFRSLTPESVEGSEIGSHFETLALSLERKITSSTYFTITGELLSSNSRRNVGIISVDTMGVPGMAEQDIDYRERALTVSLNQLLGNESSIGLRYRLIDSRVIEFFPQTFAANALFDGPFRARSILKSTLHEVDLHGAFSNPTGFFMEGHAVWYAQSNGGYSPSRPGDTFWQLNAIGGYRFLQRRAEFALGVLNINNENYKLNPLTPYVELPRKRTALVRLRLTF